MQTTGDAVGDSSIISGTNFPGGIIAGADYLNPNGMSIRSPADSLSHVFGGNSLEIDGVFNDKSRGGVLTIADLRFNGGTYSSNRDNSGAQNLAGTINLIGPASFVSTTGALIFTPTIASKFTGPGTLTVTMTAAAGSKYTFSNSANDYTGGTSLTAGMLEVTQNSGLGTGDVAVSGSGTLLRLDASATIGTGARLSVASGSTVDLAFVGSDTIGGLMLGGEAMPNGLYTALNSGGFLTGTGTLTVVPEPAVSACIALAFAALLSRRLRAYN